MMESRVWCRGDNMDDDDETQSRKRRHPSQDDEPSGETDNILSACQQYIVDPSHGTFSIYRLCQAVRRDFTRIVDPSHHQ